MTKLWPFFQGLETFRSSPLADQPNLFKRQLREGKPLMGQFSKKTKNIGLDSPGNFQTLRRLAPKIFAKKGPFLTGLFSKSATLFITWAIGSTLWAQTSPSPTPVPKEGQLPALERSMGHGERSFEDLEFSILSSSEKESSERELIQRFQNNSLNPKWPYLLSIMYLNMKSKTGDDSSYLLDSSARMARQSFELSRKSPYGYLALAQLLSYGKQPDKALSILEKMADAFPEETWRRELFQVKILFPAGRSEEGLAKISQLMTHSNRSVRLLTMKLCRDFCGDQVSHLKEHEILAWQKSTSSPETILLAAEYYGFKGRFDQSRTTLIKGLETFPKETSLTLTLATELTARSPLNPTLAIKILEDLGQETHLSIKNEVDSSPSTELAQNVTRGKLLGLAWLLKKDLLRAETHYLKALSLNPNQEIVLAIMDDYRAEKLTRAGLSFLEKALDISPGNYALHALRAEIYADEAKGFSQSEDSYFDAISLNPRNSTLFNSLGLLYYKYKHLDKALTSFSIATVINPKNANAYYNLACIEALTGEKEKALASLTKALELSPGLQTLATKDSDLTSLHVIPQFNQLTSKQLSH